MIISLCSLVTHGYPHVSSQYGKMGIIATFGVATYPYGDMVSVQDEPRKRAKSVSAGERNALSTSPRDFLKFCEFTRLFR